MSHYSEKRGTVNNPNKVAGEFTEKRNGGRDVEYQKPATPQTPPIPPAKKAD